MRTGIALFDFDKTIIVKDSILILFNKTYRAHPEYLGGIFSGSIKTLFRGKAEFRETIKSDFLSMLNYYSPEELRDFVLRELLPKYAFQEAVEAVAQCKEEGLHTLLVSASAEEYLQYVGEVLPFDGILGTKLDENYRIIGRNNRFREKVYRINQYLIEHDLELDFDASRGYSDSYAADHPMLEMVKDRYLINEKKTFPGYTNLSWRQVGLSSL
ncbi:MAG: HAD family hydrolase [Tissierellia bacterium]|nr:HAD family hydrolase [Tissierellia bacterium]